MVKPINMLVAAAASLVAVMILNISSIYRVQVAYGHQLVESSDLATSVASPQPSLFSKSSSLNLTDEMMLVSENNRDRDNLDSDPNNSINSYQNNATTSAKLKPVNFTQVEEIFKLALNDTDLVKKWKQMDFQLQEGIKAILKMIFPQIVAISQDAKVSGDCSGGILKWILSLRNLRSWAVRMLDATGKPTSGIFEGSLSMLGNYRQCLSIRSPDEDEIEITDQFEEYFRGQFCVLHFRPWLPQKRRFYHLNSTIETLVRKQYKYYEKTLYDDLAEIASAFNFVNLRMDLCVPSTCTESDIQRVADLLSRQIEMRAKVMRCDTEPKDPSLWNQIDFSCWFWLVASCCLVSISVVATCARLLLVSIGKYPTKHRGGIGAGFATILDCLSMGVILQNRLSTTTDKSTIHQSHTNELYQMQANINEANKLDTNPIEASKMQPTCMIQHASQHQQQQQQHQDTRIKLEKPISFSQSSNTSGPQLCWSSSARLNALYGLRNLIIFWFLIVQMTTELNYQYLRESLVLRDLLFNYWPFQILVNNTFIFQSLITITAFTFSYSCLAWSTIDIWAYFVRKYLRLIPAIIVLITLTIFTPMLAINSPVWRNMLDEQAETCKSTGYLNLFFVQNFISYDKVCLPHTWLFCVELQLAILSIPLIVLLKQTLTATQDSLVMQNNRPNSTQNRNILKLALYQLVCSKVGILSMLLIVAAFMSNIYVVFTSQLPPAWFSTFPEIDDKTFYFSHYLTKSSTHLSSFLVGLIGGYLARAVAKLTELDHSNKPANESQQVSPSPSSSSSNIQSQFNSESTSGSSSPIVVLDSIISPQSSYRLANSTSSNTQQTSSNRSNNNKFDLQSWCLSIAALCAMLASIFSTFSWSTRALPSIIIGATYDACSRLIWSLALVSFMIRLSFPNNSNSVAFRLLAHPNSIIIGRLSLLAYLISPYIHTLILAVQEQPLFPSLFIIFHLIVGNILLTYLLALLLAIVIEQPASRLVSRLSLSL